MEKAAAAASISTPAKEPESLRTNGPATAEQVAEIKRIVTELNQTKPGTAEKFKSLMAAKGLTKISDLSLRDSERLIQQLKAKAMEAFFDKALEPFVAAGETPTLPDPSKN